MLTRTQKTFGSPDPRGQSSQAASEPIFEASAGYDFGRGGPILEESNVLIGTNRLEDEPGQRARSTDEAQTQNYVARFFNDASTNSSSAMLASQPRMDVAQYWEKRRVQNVLRRVLEAIQEKFGLDGEVQSGDLGNVFDVVAQHAGHSEALNGQGGLGERPFISALETLQLWPPELSPDDRSEIFHALLVPSISAARGVLNERGPMRTVLTRHLFREGFEYVPFNLPDFPVPTHLITAALPLEKFKDKERSDVTEAVATTFCLPKTGVDKAKDFFICGLLSLEEIQMGLPRLLPHAVVEDAVTRVIRRGAPLMSPEEWHDLVLAVRTPQACGQTPVEDVAPEQASPRNLQREVNDDFAHQVEASPQRTNFVVDWRAMEQFHPEKNDTAKQTPLSSTPIASTPSQSPALPSRSSPGDHAVGASAGATFSAMPSTPAAQVRELREAAPTAEAMLAGLPSLASPELQHRNVREQQWGFAEGELDGEPDGTISRFRGRFEPVTEPLPCRAMRSEEPVSFALGSVQGPTRVVDWNTARPEAPDRGVALRHQASSSTTANKVIGWHKADEGAGARLSWGTSCFKQELAAAAGKSSGTEAPVLMPCGADPVAWINIDLHHECGGPYLSRAFVRCCQLFQEASRNPKKRIEPL